MNENEPTPTRTLAELLHTKRQHRALTQRSAALELGVSKVTYNHWENGRRIPTMRMRNLVARWLGVDLRAVGDACVAGVKAKRAGVSDV